jgi:CHAD domain-containing protein
MREYARSHTAMLLRRFAFQANRTARVADADSIHDLRVAIRRLSRSLRVFSQFFPADSRKKTRRQLSELLQAAGDVRDRDIALDLLEKAGVSRDSVLGKQLETERRAAVQQLMVQVRTWHERGSFAKWRTRLEL